MASIQKRGPHQYLVRVRRNGVSKFKTFETVSEAEEWARFLEGKITGGEIDANSADADASLRAALDWYELVIVPRTPRSSKGKIGQIKYWRASRFADWSLKALHPWDLLEWRRGVLDEDNAEDGEQIGPEAEFSAQTCVHRLNLISHLYGQWSLIHRVSLDNPVVRGVRPELDNGRNRRLDSKRDRKGHDEEARLLIACDDSNSTWLGAAARIALETCIRQAELAGLDWKRVHLSGQYPYLDLPKTKNDLPRRVPLSKAAVKAFKSFVPKGAVAATAGKVLPIETPRAVGHAFRTSVKDDKFPDLRWHDLRHEAISRLFEKTDLRDHEIMAITGHLSPEMLRRYTHLRSHRLAKRLG
ncbi:MAG TPA: site-specific integrase [Magnetospirillaceae bacterium]